MKRLATATVCMLVASTLWATEPSPSPSVQVQYVEPTNAALREFVVEFRDGQFLEAVASHIEGRFKLPAPLLLSLEQCGEANAYYVSTHKAVVLCVELFPYLFSTLLRDRSLRRDEERANAVMSGAIAFVTLHEVGHAVIDLYSLPVLGREEDAADQISAYLLLTDSDPQTRVEGVTGGLWFFRTGRSPFSLQHLSGQHGLSQQREANLACWAYGSNPAEFRWALRAGRVSPARAQRCEAEYTQLKSAVQRLLGTNLLPSPALPR